MPTISVFFGISVRMYYDDHAPPHFHVYYGDMSAKVAIDTLDVIDGQIPKRAMSLIVEWAIEHRQELRENWIAAREHRPLTHIAPLN